MTNPDSGTGPKDAPAAESVAEGSREILIWAIGIDHTHPFEEELMDAAFALGEKYDIDIGGIGGYAPPVELS